MTKLLFAVAVSLTPGVKMLSSMVEIQGTLRMVKQQKEKSYSGKEMSKENAILKTICCFRVDPIIGIEG